MAAQKPRVTKVFLVTFFSKKVTSFFFLSLLVTTPRAWADDSITMALERPAVLTPHAAFGLITSIARAGARLVAAGERGRILLSDDNGATWRQVETPTSVTLTHITFAGPTQGWALGQMGLVLHTTDSGASWTPQLNGIIANQITLAAARAGMPATGATGADTANLQNAEALAGGGPSVPFLDLLVTSPGHLLVTGGFGLAMTSTDSGAHWQSIAGQLANPQGLHLYGLAQTAGSVFIAGEQGLILSGPLTGPFRPLTTPFSGTYFGILATPGGTLIAYGLQGTIITSSDRGQHWQPPPTGVTAGIDAALTLADGRLLFGDIAGDLLLSPNGGQKITPLGNAGEPVAALAQAADGSLIIGGPFGLRRLPPPAEAAAQDAPKP